MKPLTKEELQNVIERFDQDELKKQAIFKIAQYGGGSDESFITANKEGLQLYALILLEAARDSDQVLSKSEKKVSFDFEVDWIDEDSDTHIHYIDLIAGKRTELRPKTYRRTVMDKIGFIGCYSFVVLIAISIVVGLIVIFRWLF